MLALWEVLHADPQHICPHTQLVTINKLQPQHPRSQHQRKQLQLEALEQTATSKLIIRTGMEQPHHQQSNNGNSSEIRRQTTKNISETTMKSGVMKTRTK